ncbi:MAG: hypothetical protein HQ559_17810 [Lentisphaerae bacterium]|nr:hypothetical protein [Lentisphaerota bacterium]
MAYTNEAAFVAALDALGFVWILESFEDGEVWGGARYPGTEQAVTNLSVRWTSNNDSSEITTSTGPPRTGDWGFFSLPHGSYGGGADCTVPGNCGDGFVGTAIDTFYGVGAWVEGFFGSKLTLYLDGANLAPVEFPEVCDAVGENCVDYAILTPAHKFFGVIDVDGFQTFEFREIEGTAEDQKFIWSDDVTVALSNPPPAIIRDIVVGGSNEVVLTLKNLAIKAEYNIERTSSLDPTAWTPGTPFVASSSSTNRSVPASNTWSSAFYQVSGK